ncbi:MAG: imelysin family protein [Saprospiraceae bacterium]
MKRYLFLFSFLFLFACGEDPIDPGTNNPTSDTFDRQQMLTDWADNNIIPAYEDFAEHTQSMREAAEALVAEPSEANYSDLAVAWGLAYEVWQRVSMFEIGKAEELSYRNKMNIYPADVETIEENIVTGSYNLELPSTIDEQGFPALDYLLFGVKESHDATRDFYTTSEAESYRNYILMLVERMDEMTDEILADWQQNFRTTFIENDGNSVTASVDKMVNDFIFYYEKALRAGKVGIPAGVFSGDPLSDRVEALYLDTYSKELFFTALDATQRFFNGIPYNNGSATGESLRTYLETLGTEKDGQNLADVIDAQFEAAKAEASKLDNSFRQQVETDNIAMLTVFDALQLNVVNLKVDMLQALNINVDYVDADGD